MNKPKRMPTKPIDVRYKPTRATITSKLAQHFAQFAADLEERGGKADVDKLCQYMGVTTHRWNELIKNNQPPLLCEAASYSKYMLIDINELYEDLPFNQTKSKAA